MRFRKTIILENIGKYLKVNFWLFIYFLLLGNLTYSQKQDFSVNEKGASLLEIQCKTLPRKFLTSHFGNLTLSDSASLKLWRKSILNDEYFYLDLIGSPADSTRLRATSYLGANLTGNGLEGRNDDVKWKIVPDENDWVLIQHKSSGRYLYFDGINVNLIKKPSNLTGARWLLSLKEIDLNVLESPILMMGNDNTGFRDPAVIYEKGMFYMYFSYVLTEEDEKIYWYVAMSKSVDLVHWSEPKILTEKNQSKNFASPGSITRFNDQWILSMQSYVMPDYTRRDPIRYGNDDCRVWIMRSNDLENWSKPEKLYVRGPNVEPEGMIDSYLVEDKSEKGKWWCFFKPNTGGTGYSYSRDLVNWKFKGFTDMSGENVCVWVEKDTYYMMHSPDDGVGILKSKDLVHWTEFTKPNTLGKEHWSWASKRVTAGFVLDMRRESIIGKYLLFFHGQGPPPQSTEIINSGTDIGIAWSDDLIHWKWPGRIDK